MTTSETKEKLLLYRGWIDDADPQFQEALAHARRDPEVGEWLQDQVRCYDAIRSRLHELEPPVDFGEEIVRNRPIQFRRNWRQILELAAAIILSAGVTAAVLEFRQTRSGSIAGGKEITVRGEVLDMTCYIASNLSGPEHAVCAKECIRRGLPAGLKTGNGKVYLLTGEPGQAVNAQLAEYAAQIVTIQGKETSRDGFAQLRVEEIRKF